MYLDTAYRISSLVSNPNTFGVLMAFGIILGMLLHSQHQIQWFEFYPGALLFIATIIFSGSRNAFFVVFLGVAILLFMLKFDIGNFKKDRLKLFASGIAVVILVFFMWRAIPDWMFSNITVHLVHGSLSLRVLLWQSALQEIINHPFMGIGVGVFPNVIGNKLLGVDGFIHTHNIIFNILVDMGVIGFIVAIYFLYYLLRSAHLRSPIIAVPLLLIFMSQLFDYFMHDIVFAVIAMFFFALAGNSGLTPIEQSS